MREEDHLAAFVGDLGDGRLDALDAGRVGDATLAHRHVEVDAEEDALVGDVSLIESAEARHLVIRSSCNQMDGSPSWLRGLRSGSGLMLMPLRENATTSPTMTSMTTPKAIHCETMTRA